MACYRCVTGLHSTAKGLQAIHLSDSTENENQIQAVLHQEYPKAVLPGEEIANESTF